jgi:hypothetical protein
MLVNRVDCTVHILITMQMQKDTSQTYEAPTLYVGVESCQRFQGGALFERSAVRKIPPGLWWRTHTGYVLLPQGSIGRYARSHQAVLIARHDL